MKTINLTHKEVQFIKKYFPILVKGLQKDINDMRNSNHDGASLNLLYSIQEYRIIARSILSKVSEKNEDNGNKNVI